MLTACLLLNTNAIAQSVSPSYRLDYERNVSDAGHKQSASYNLLGAITNISADGDSSTYNLRNVYSSPTVVAGPVCGNGLIEGTEQCEGNNFNGLSCADYGYSLGNLTCVNCLIVPNCYNEGGNAFLCGNGIKEANEQCDDGNTENGDGCTAGCRFEEQRCGNGKVESGEQCDDGNTENNDGCSAECKEEIPVIIVESVCGNGVQEEGEQCDDGNSLSGDGCSNMCRIEKPKEEFEFGFEVVEEPYVIIKPKPVPSFPPLRPSAPEKEFNQFHYENFETEAMVTVLDETPFVVVQLEANANYEMLILDAEDKEISRQGVQADENGIVKAESLPYLEYKTYKLLLLNKKHETVKAFNFTIEDRKYRLQEVLGLDGEDIRETISLGEFKLGDKKFIEGKGKSGTTYYSYYQSLEQPKLGKVNPVTITKSIANTEGDYKIPVPENLKAGTYHIDIVQVYDDGKVSRNKRYVFELTEDQQRWQNIWILVAIALMAIASRLEPLQRKIRELKNKLKKKKKRKKLVPKPDNKRPRNGFKVRMLLSLIVLLASSYATISTALAITTTPQVFIYEGKLLDTSNNPITTPQTFRFSLWASQDLIGGDLDGTGAINGTAGNFGGWQESQTVTPNSDGTFFFELGAINPLPNMDLALHKFLQVEIKPQGAIDTSYELMDPSGDNGADTNDRQTIGSAPFTNNADFIDYAELGTGAGNIATLDIGGIWSINFMPEGTNFDTFIIDHDDTVGAGGNINLQFGSTLGAAISFDVTNNWFSFNNDINLNQNEIKNAAIDNLAIAPATPVPGQIYYNTTNGNTYIWNGAVWEDITATGSGSVDLDIAYTNDVDKKLNINNAAGLEFESTVAGDIVFDLQGAGDLVVQSGGTPYATFTNSGQVGIGTGTPSSILDVNSNAANTSPIFTLGNTAGDIQMFRADASPEGSITGSIGDLAIDGTNGNAYIKNSGDSTNSGWIQFGGQKVKQMVFNAEYEDSVYIGDGTENRGTLTSDKIDVGSIKYNYVEWNTTKSTLQDVDIVLSITLPDDFISFTATPLQFVYNTSDANTINNKLDLYLYDSLDNPVTLTGANNLANGSWTTANVTFGGSPTFTAGQTITLVIKASANSAGFARAANVIFDYNGS